MFYRIIEITIWVLMITDSAQFLLPLGRDSGAANEITFSDYSVTDGDTILAKDTRVRLFGIDAPELDEQGGGAQRFLEAFTDGRTIRCHVVDTDRYGRIVGRCYVGDMDLSCAMVASGHARDWPRYSGGLYQSCAQATPMGRP